HRRRRPRPSSRRGRARPSPRGARGSRRCERGGVGARSSFVGRGRRAGLGWPFSSARVPRARASHRHYDRWERIDVFDFPKIDTWDESHMNRMSVEERRAQLVDAAMTIAVREGVEAVTIRGVAAEAGVSLGVVHYCFEDKDELLQAMGNSLALVASEPVRAALDVDGDVVELAHAAADGLWSGLTPRRHMRLLTFEFATAGVRSRALRSVAHTHLEQTWAMTRGFLENVADRGNVTYSMDLGFLSRIVAGYIAGIETAWLVAPDAETPLRGLHARRVRPVGHGPAGRVARARARSRAGRLTRARAPQARAPGARPSTRSVYGLAKTPSGSAASRTATASSKRGYSARRRSASRPWSLPQWGRPPTSATIRSTASK